MATSARTAEVICRVIEPPLFTRKLLRVAWLASMPSIRIALPGDQTANCKATTLRCIYALCWQNCHSTRRRAKGEKSARLCNRYSHQLTSPTYGDIFV